MDRDEIAKIANDEITERFQRIGIWDQVPDDVEKTRANFRLVNEIRQARDSQRGAFKRSFREIATSFSGQALWVIVFSIVTILAPIIWKALTK